jgi:hypothetical protein
MSKLSIYGRAGSRASAWRRQPMIRTPRNVARFEEHKMTPEQKAEIDGMDYEGLLRRWRFSPAGDPMFQGDTGEYFLARMVAEKKRAGEAEAAETSRRIGWTEDMRKQGR